MKKTLLLLFVVIFFLILNCPTSADIINGGFEDDLTGWTLNSGIGNAIGSYSSLNTSLSLSPQEGSKFLKLEHGGLTYGYGDLIQDIELNAGDVISGWVAFEVAGTSLSRISMTYNSTPYTVWETSSSGYGTWEYWSWMAPETTNYTLRFYAIASGIFGDAYSVLLVDGIRVLALPPSPNPPSCSFLAVAYLVLPD